jgi:ATP-binding cassette, subfamily B, bacterial
MTSPATRAAKPRSSGRKRVPIVLQTSSYDCGAACLAMVLGHLGRPVEPWECEDCFAGGRNGASAAAIVRSARRFGLEAEQYSLELEGLGELALPAIVYWQFRHFLVVERITETKVEVVDPSSGRISMTREAFGKGFTGIALTFSAGPEFQRVPRRAGSQMGQILRLLGNSRYPRLVVQLFLASLLLQGIGLAFPLFTKIILDGVLPSHSLSYLETALSGFGAAIVARFTLGLARGRALVLLQSRLDSTLLAGLFRHLLSLPPRFFQLRSPEDLLSRVNGYVTVRELLASRTLGVLLDGLLLVAYSVSLLLTLPAFGVLALGCGGLEAAAALVTSKRRKALLQESLAAQSENQTLMNEAMHGISMLKTTGAEESVFRIWSNIHTRQLNATSRRQRTAASLEAFSTAIRSATPLLVLTLGTYQVMQGSLSIGSMIALNALVAGISVPLGTMVGAVQQLQMADVYVRRLNVILLAEPERSAAEVAEAPRLRGDLELRDVSFRYSDDSPEILRNVSLKVRRGEKIAIVGSSGSGKSTLAAILLGLLPPSKGQVLYDDLPSERFDLRQLRRQMGAVLQEPPLFTMNIRQNICLAHPEMKMDAVIAACRSAAIDQEIEAMPMGYETPLMAGLRSLSGGQKQRIALARALVNQPAILVLDEATSAVDRVTERRIHENLRALSCTQVVIAHRLSTVRDADLIVVLDRGAIVEQGRHDELCARNGHYAALVSPGEAGGTDVPANGRRHLQAVVNAEGGQA